MKAPITREQIIATTLSLARDERGLGHGGFREIARALGCAHTNLYNYYPSYTALLWDAHSAIHDESAIRLEKAMAGAGSPDGKLHTLFGTLVSFYLDNPGWFRLAWMEHIGEERPESNIAATKAARAVLDQYAAEVWQAFTGKQADPDELATIVHNIHCYVIGEVSNFLCGRRLIGDEKTFRDYVRTQAVRLYLLYIREG